MGILADMETIERVRQLVLAGKSDQYVIDKLDITRRELGAYKAHITRRVQKVLGGAKESCIVLSRSDIKSLTPVEQTCLASILERLKRNSNGHSEGLEKRVKTERGSLPNDIVKGIIIELKNSGLPNDKVYDDPRLKGVDEGSISAYLAHYTRGSYKN